MERGLAAMYLVAFLVAANQFVPLAGAHGLTPAAALIARVPFRYTPSLFYLDASDWAFQVAAWTGVVVSLALVTGLPSRAGSAVAAAAWGVLWLLYSSFVNVGGDPDALTLPRAWLPGTYDFSFSGLKTAVLRLTREVEAAGGDIPVADVARAFQDAVVDVLVTKTVAAAAAYSASEVLLAGGVAANAALREAIAAQSPVPVRYPAVWLCTDNAAMIGAAGYFAWEDGRRSGADDIEPSLVRLRCLCLARLWLGSRLFFAFRHSLHSS